MDKNNSYFYLSGLISLSLFTFISFLFIQTLFSNSKIKSYALKKDNFISVSISMPELKTKSSKKNTVVPIIETQVPIEAKEIDIGNLFSDVQTKEITKEKKEKKPEENKRIQEIQKRIKSSEAQTPNQIAEEFSKGENAKVTSKNTPSSTADEVNEYFAKINALVYSHFYPPLNSQGHSVKAVIELSAIGKVLDFRILNNSNNADLNEECAKIKKRLSSVLFPINPENKSGRYVIILTSEE